MKLILKSYFPLIILAFVIVSCSNDSKLEYSSDSNVYTSDFYLTTHKQIDIKRLFTAMALSSDYGIDARYADGVMSDVQVRMLEYQTKLDENKDEKIVASGLICYPTEPGSYPIISFQNGTNVLNSKSPTGTSPIDLQELITAVSAGADVEVDLFLLLESISSMGFIVVIPDYPGFGSSAVRTHPYLVKDKTIPALKDMILASKEFLELEVKETTASDSLFLMGYSQGGWATLQLQQEIETKGLSGFNLIASSAGAGPYSISTLFPGMIKAGLTEQPYFYAFMMDAYDKYAGLHDSILSYVFNEPYDTIVPWVFKRELPSKKINDTLKHVKNVNLINQDYISFLNAPGVDPNSKYIPLHAEYIKNDVVPWGMVTPTRLYHGVDDKTVPAVVTANMYNDLIASGTSKGNLHFYPIMGKGHSSAVVPFGLSTIDWFLSIK